MSAYNYLQFSTSNNNNDRLPFDIKTEITNYLSQRDCLTCMMVCRAWKKQLPQYSQLIWSKLRIYPTNIIPSYQYQQLWEQCIGHHVKSVIFDGFQLDDEEERLYTVMYKLIDNQCHRIKSIEFSDCNTRNEVLLVKLLKKLTSLSTTELKFTRHSNDLYLAHLMHTCPSLAHFSYSRSYYNGFRKTGKRITATGPYIARPKLPLLPITYQQDNKEQPHLFPNLISFKVESRCSDPIVLSQINSILEHSPALRHLIYELRADGLFTFCNDFVSLDLKQIFLSCPKLQYLRGNVSDDDFVFSKHTHYLDVTSTSSITDSLLNEDGLYYFMGCETRTFSPEKMAPHILRNKSTLKFLLFKGSIPAHSSTTTLSNWTSLLQSIVAPKLRKLVFYNIVLDNNPDTIPIMASNCPLLEDLAVEAYFPNNRRTMRLNITRLAMGTRRLKRLTLTGITIQVNYDNNYSNRSSVLSDAEQEEEDQNNKLIENIFRTTWTELQDIYMSNIHLVYHAELQFYKSLTRLPQLKHLEIPNRLALAIAR